MRSISSREREKKRHAKRKQNVNAKRVPVAAALELRRAVVAKVVAHFFIYLYIRECVFVCDVFLVFETKRERETVFASKVKP